MKRFKKTPISWSLREVEQKKMGWFVITCAKQQKWFLILIRSVFPSWISHNASAGVYASTGTTVSLENASGNVSGWLPSRRGERLTVTERDCSSLLITMTFLVTVLDLWGLLCDSYFMSNFFIRMYFWGFVPETERPESNPARTNCMRMLHLKSGQVSLVRGCCCSLVHGWYKVHQTGT